EPGRPGHGDADLDPAQLPAPGARGHASGVGGLRALRPEPARAGGLPAPRPRPAVRQPFRRGLRGSRTPLRGPGGLSPARPQRVRFGVVAVLMGPRATRRPRPGRLRILAALFAFTALPARAQSMALPAELQVPLILK